MRRTRLIPLIALAAVAATTTAATRLGRTRSAPVVTHEIIAVYLGTEGTDAPMPSIVRGMQQSLASQAAAAGEHFISRGVSLEPSVEGGLRHLKQLGTFDEVSVGGNWTNSSVVHYLGPTMNDKPRARIPQVVLVRREVRTDISTLEVGAETEIARFTGAEIGAWVRRGAPLPR